MKLATIRKDGRVTCAVEVFDGLQLLDGIVGDGADIYDIIEAGPEGLDAILGGFGSKQEVVTFEECELLAPIPFPRRNIICVGKNYYDHAEEFEQSGYDRSSGGIAFPEHPVVFTKAAGSVIGPGQFVETTLDPDNTLDYEGELVVVIGSTGRGIPRARAWEFVYGYTILNDITSRAVQQRHKQWFLGKSSDTFAPMGPFIVTSDEIPDVRELTLKTLVNEDLRQHASVGNLIFDIPSLIECISRSMTLRAGDLVATRTPAGVGLGFDPPRYLAAGDVVTVEIDHIGRLTNPVQ